VQCDIEESFTQSIAWLLISTLFNLSDSIGSSDRITPNPIRSDRGYRMKKLDPIRSDIIRSDATLTYHPQSQGLVEKSHSTLTDCLAMYTSANLKDWDNLLPHIIFSINCSIHETTRESPFFYYMDEKQFYKLKQKGGYRIRTKTWPVI